MFRHGTVFKGMSTQMRSIDSIFIRLIFLILARDT